MKKIVHFLLLVTLFFVSSMTKVQAQDTYLKRVTFGTNSLQEARRVIKTPDNKYLVVGYVANNAASLDRDGLVFKMEENGNILWANKYGGANWEEFYDVVQSGSYYYCIGYTRTWTNGTFFGSPPPPPIPPPPNLIADVFVVKMKLDGTVVWAKHMGKPTNGTSAGDGNDYGLRGIACAQGGVIVVSRMNIGFGSDQNSGLIWVDSDGKTRWAYQYDFPNNTAANELTQGIWKDGTQTYVTGGWFNKFNGITGGFLYKVDQNGAIIWQKFTEVANAQFESQYNGYYNHNNGKMYTTDFYNQNSASIREIQVMTNLSATGLPPAPGAIPQAKRFHYGAAGSSGNNHRAFIFPVGDGYQQFIVGGSEVTGPTAGVIRRATIIAASADLVYQWTKKIGSGIVGSQSQLNDLLTCQNNTQSLLAVGSVNRLSGSVTLRDVMISKIRSASTLLDCEVSAPINNSNLSLTATNTDLVRINLKTICNNGLCWANDNLIPAGSVVVTPLNASPATECTGPVPPPPSQSMSFIEPTESTFGGELSALSFSFSKQPKEVYFEISDLNGDFIYERFFGNISKLQSGFNIQDMKLDPKEYVWEIQAVYEDQVGIEVRRGVFKLD